MGKTCCPEGYLYDPGLAKCLTLNHTNPIDPIDCPCCPKGFIWDSINQICGDSFGNTSAPLAPCPCCPEGYTYTSESGLCQRETGSGAVEPSDVYCIPCNCTIVTPPSCPTCGTQGQHISFEYNPNIKNCSECIAEDLLLTKNKCLNSFLPIQFISPLINFKLTNRNFI